MITVTKRFAIVLLVVLSPILWIRAQIELQHVSTFYTDNFDAGAAEIVAYDASSKRIFFTNADNNSIGVLDVADPANPVLIDYISQAAYGGGVNSVAVASGVVAVAVEANDKVDAGRVTFWSTDGAFLADYEVGALPDMITFDASGTKLFVANEGEPNDAYTVDPEGSISIIDLSAGVQEGVVTHIAFEGLGSKEDLVAQGIRIFGPNASVAQDLEPEYIAVSDDNSTLYVVCQENNALIVVDVNSATASAILPLGTKDHSIVGQGVDASNRDDLINITNYPIQGMFMPDAIKYITIDGQSFLLSANEGDARDYDGYSEEARVKDLILDPTAYPNADLLQQDDMLGRLLSTTASGDIDGDGDVDIIHSYGARSFSIWNATTGALVWDSGDQFEQIVARELPANFNCQNDDNDFDSRSDDKGPEPEAIEVAVIGDKTYAFVGLERIGGIMIYDITIPTAPEFVQYINNRNFSADVESREVGDLGVECILYVAPDDAPNGEYMIITANEVSGTISIFQQKSEEGITTPNMLTGLNGYETEDFFTVGESINGYRPTGIWDGLGAISADEYVRLYVNSEITSAAGYPYTLANGTQLRGSRVHMMEISKSDMQVTDAKLAYHTIIDRSGSEVTSGLQLEGDEATDGLTRLCSAVLFESGEYGLEDDIFFTGEESGNGTEFCLDIANEVLYAAPWLGRASWENVTLLEAPEGQVAVLIGDDRAPAPLLLYIGEKQSGGNFLERNGLSEGKLYVWVADNGATTPEEFKGTGSDQSGKFVEIDIYEPGAAGYDALGFATIEKQDELAASVGAFFFSRPEDVATNPENGTQAVMASTGRGQLYPSDDFGTTYRIDMDFGDMSADLTILYDGDDAGAGQFEDGDFGLRSPDNLEWASDGFIYLQEDKSTRLNAFGGLSGEEASIWKLDPVSGSLTRIAQVDRSAVPSGMTDGAVGDIGNWETSGIIDVSDLFSTPAEEILLIATVQAHSVRDGIIASEELVQGGQLNFIRGPREEVAEAPIGTCEAPSWVRVRPSSANRYSVQWERVRGARGYILDIEMVGGKPQSIRIPVRSSKVRISLPSGRVAQVSITTICSDGTETEIGRKYYLRSTEKANAAYSQSPIEVEEVYGSVASLQVGVAPNPTSGIIQITHEGAQQFTRLQVFNANGALVLTQALNDRDNAHKIDISNLSQGLYFISLTDNIGNHWEGRLLKVD